MPPIKVSQLYLAFFLCWWNFTKKWVSEHIVFPVGGERCSVNVGTHELISSIAKFHDLQMCECICVFVFVVELSGYLCWVCVQSNVQEIVYR
jgi:hypothetical protein